MLPTPKFCWTAVANIVRERPYGPGGVEIRRGTKHFAPGAKVYIIDWYAGGCERIVVVGQHRGSKRMVALVIDVKLVENLRAKVCYQPAVLSKIKDYYDRGYSPARIKYLTQEFAETVCQTIPYWQLQPWRQPQVFPLAASILPNLGPSSSQPQRQPPAAAAAPLLPLRPATSPLARLWLHLRFLLRH